MSFAKRFHGLKGLWEGIFVLQQSTTFSENFLKFSENFSIFVASLNP